jgi:hypothetical protein
MDVVGKSVWLFSVRLSVSQIGDRKTLFQNSPAKRVLHLHPHYRAATYNMHC